MRMSLAYTLIRHRIHLHVTGMRTRVTYRHGIPADTFDRLANDMKRSREAIVRIQMIAQSHTPQGGEPNA